VEIRRHVGYMPADYTLYPNLTGAETLRYYANLRGGVDERVVADLAERLEADLSRKNADLSSGNRQKVALIAAFMNEPELLILDEPSSGLDPLMQQELQAIIREVRADGRTVFLSSHSLSEVERVADRVGILREGRLIVVERVDILKDKAIRRLDLEFETPVSAEDFRAVPGVRSVEAHGHGLSISFEGSVNALLQVALEHRVVDLNSREADLEEIFLAYYRGAGNGSAADAG
jgi:ABC-2 type transport system ATP-binding protein